MATSPHDVLNFNLLSNVKSFSNLDNNMMLKLNLLHRKIFESFSKLFRNYQTNVLLLLMFLSIKHSIVLPRNHLFANKNLPQEKNSLPNIIEIDIISLLTIVFDISPQTIATLLLTTLPTQNRTHALLPLRAITQPTISAIPHTHLFHFLWWIKSLINWKKFFNLLC